VILVDLEKAGTKAPAPLPTALDASEGEQLLGVTGILKRRSLNLMPSTI